MTDNTIKIASSGLNAAEKKLRNSADNIANLNSKGYRKKKVNQKEAPTGGVSTDIVRANDSSGQEIENSTAEIPAGSNVDVVEESVNMINIVSSAKANAKVIRTEDETLGKIINVKS